MLREALQMRAAHSRADRGRRARFRSPLEMEGRGARAHRVPRSLLESVCDTKTPQGVCAELRFAPAAAPIDAICPTSSSRSTAFRTPATWARSGARRTRRAFAACSIGGGSADPLSPKVLRAAMGSGLQAAVRAGGVALRTR